MSDNTTGRFINIQALRAIAAILIMSIHLCAQPFFSKVPFQSLFFQILQHGLIGVDIFFIISGFIMAYTTKKTWGDKTNFFLARVIRIYPLYWICTILWTLKHPLYSKIYMGHFSQLPYYVGSLLLLPVLNSKGELYPILQPGWTLVYEMFFYFLFTCLMFGPRQHITLKMGLILGMAYLSHWIIPPQFSLHPFLAHPIYFEFVMGCFLARLFELKKLNSPLLIGLTLLSILVMGCYPWLHESHENFRFIYYGIPAFTIVFAGLYLEAKNIVFPPLFKLLGDSSYSLYLTHSLTFKLLSVVALPFILLFSRTPVLLLFWFFSILLGVICHLSIEKPIHQKLKSLIEYPPPQLQKILE